MTKDLVNQLKLVAEFKSVPEDQLQWLADKGHIRLFKDGDKVFGKGDDV